MRKSLDTKPRGRMSKGEINQMRRDGQVPVSLSTRGGETEHYSVPRQGLAEILRTQGASAIIELKGTSKKGTVLAISRDIQYDAISRKLIHVGFQHVSATDAITADVRVNLVGIPEEVKQGSHRLEQVLGTVQIKARPDKLPAHVDIEVSDLQSGSVLQVASLWQSSEYEIVTPADTVVAVMHYMTRAAEPEAEAAAEEKAPAEEAAPAEE